MGTRLNPGRFDCYAAALPDEEQFVLNARDVAFAPTIEHWRALRNAMIDRGEKPTSDWEMIAEAGRCAERGVAWRKEATAGPEPRWRTEQPPETREGWEEAYQGALRQAEGTIGRLNDENAALRVSLAEQGQDIETLRSQDTVSRHTIGLLREEKADLLGRIEEGNETIRQTNDELLRARMQLASSELERTRLEDKLRTSRPRHLSFIVTDLAAKIACGIRQVTTDMMADQMDALTNGEFADRLNGYAAELEAESGRQHGFGIAGKTDEISADNLRRFMGLPTLGEAFSREEPEIVSKMLSECRIGELLDYATVYGEWDENTPNGTTTALSGEPMNDYRRVAIVIYKKVLGLIPEDTEISVGVAPPVDLAEPPEINDHRFGSLEKFGDYAYARGLTVAPQHLPKALHQMEHEFGWRLIAIFGETTAEKIGFIFRRREAHMTPEEIDRLIVDTLTSKSSFINQMLTGNFHSGGLVDPKSIATWRPGAGEVVRPSHTFVLRPDDDAAITALRSIIGREKAKLIDTKTADKERMMLYLRMAGINPEGLHPDSAALLGRFARAMAERLLHMQSIGWHDQWKRDEWEEECRERLYRNLGSNDKVDVANFVAFMWDRNWTTTTPRTDVYPSDFRPGRFAELFGQEAFDKRAAADPCPHLIDRSCLGALYVTRSRDTTAFGPVLVAGRFRIWRNAHDRLYFQDTESGHEYAITQGEPNSALIGTIYEAALKGHCSDIRIRAEDLGRGHQP